MTMPARSGVPPSANAWAIMRVTMSVAAGRTSKGWECAVPHAARAGAASKAEAQFGAAAQQGAAADRGAVSHGRIPAVREV
ncbi:hypothetical protein [Streptomyces tailanensis]|uniref:hypothetical protein n=1 Tax=Streptomyces tailanensis TaxID=2569858 RepID=UPI00122DDC4E|nr:hypothetical protein [Streptomyces tailanensis]